MNLANPASAHRPAAKTYLCAPPRRKDPVVDKPAPRLDPPPALVEALADGANQLRQERLGAALAAFDRAAALAPNDPAAQLNRGVVLRRLGRHAEARTACERAVRLAPDWPDARYALARTLLSQKRFESAAEHLRGSLELRPDWSAAHHQLAVALQRLGRDDEALAEYERLVAAGSEDWQTHNNLAFLLLRRGEFARGFRELEWRFRCSGETPRRLHRPQPVWRGESLEGRTLLLCEEQGAGDMIQFVRLAASIRDLGCRVLVECGRPLRRLFESVPGIDGCVAPDEACPDTDFQLPLLSLPRLLGLTLDDVTGEPYVTARPDPNLEPLCGLDQFLAPFSGRLKVGLVWAGSPDNLADADRSCTPDVFAPLADDPRVELFSLQFAPTDESAEAIERSLAGLPIRSLAPWLGDFAHTAAVLERLDLIVTVDTSMVHLAGASGRETWVLLHSPGADWRWLEGRTDSPWYQSVRLFHQPRPCDWAGAVQAVRRALADRVATLPSGENRP